MKWAFTSFSCPTVGLESMLATAGRLGYDGVELRIGYGHGHGVEIEMPRESRASIRTVVEHATVDLCAIGSLVELLHSDDLSQACLEIDVLGDVACPLLRVFGGPIPKGMGVATALKRVRERLLRLAERGTKRGVLIAVETHDEWAQPDLMAELMVGADHDATGVVWDVMHTVREGGMAPPSTHTLLAPWIVHVHAHDGVVVGGELELRPMGHGDFDHVVPLGLLRDSGFSGFVSGEWIGWDTNEDHLAREVAIMRRLEGRRIVEPS